MVGELCQCHHLYRWCPFIGHRHLPWGLEIEPDIQLATQQGLKYVAAGEVMQLGLDLRDPLRRSVQKGVTVGGQRELLSVALEEYEAKDLLSLLEPELEADGGLVRCSASTARNTLSSWATATRTYGASRPCIVNAWQPVSWLQTKAMMPFITIYVFRGKSKAYIKAIADKVNAMALDTMGVPEDDRYQVIHESELEHLQFQMCVKDRVMVHLVMRGGQPDHAK